MRVKVPHLFDKTYTRNINETVIAPDLAAKILAAADNMETVHTDIRPVTIESTLNGYIVTSWLNCSNER